MVLVKRQEVPTKRVAMKVVAQFPVFDVVVLLYVVCLDILFSLMILDCLFSVWIKPGVGAVVRAVAWDPKGPEFKPRWDTEFLYVYVCVCVCACVCV